MDDHCNTLISASFDQVKVEDQFIILSKEKEKYVFLANTKRPSDKAYSEIFVHKDYWLGTYGHTFDLYENNHLVKTRMTIYSIVSFFRQKQ